MTCSDNFIFNPEAINIYLPKIMSYLPLLESSTWQFHIKKFVMLSSGKVKSILTFKLVVILPACVWHCVAEYYLGLSFFISLLVMIVELHPLSNNIWKFLNFALPFRVFIHLCMVGEYWLFNFLVRLEGFSILCSKLHSAVLFTSFSCIQVIPFYIIISYIFLSLLSNSRLCHSFLSILMLWSSYI